MMQSLKSTCKKSLWMMLLLLAGWTDGAWAADYPYTYLVINQKGEVAMWYREVQTAGEAPHIPENIRTPLLDTSAFHYYAWDDSYWASSQGVLYHRWTDRESWQEQYSSINANYKTYHCHPYGKYTIPSGATELTELPVPTNTSWGTTILVTYDANATIQPVDGITVDINGGTAYNISAYNQNITTNTNKRGYYYSNDSNGTSLSWNYNYTDDAIATAKLTDNYLWYFEGGDPYDLHLRSAKAPTGTTLSAKKNKDQDPQVSSFSFQDPTTVGRASSSDYLYHSVALFSNSSGKGPFEIMFTYQGGASRPSRPAIEHLFPYLTSNDAGSGHMIRAAWATPANMSSGATRWAHNHTDVAITLEPHYNKTCTYKVINKQWQIAIAKESSGNQLSLPDEIKSPYITNIKYYKSTAFVDAANGNFTFTATGASENTTSLNDFANGDAIYVTYDYDASAAATDGINITGSFNYGIQVGGKYLYMDNSTVSTSDTSSDQETYLWKMKSTNVAQPDPYDVKLYNGNDETTPQFSPTAFILVKNGDNLNLMVASGNTTITYLGYDTTNGLATTNDGMTASEVVTMLTAKNHNHRYWIVAEDDGTTLVAAAYPSDDECNQLVVPFTINSPLVSEYSYYISASDAENRTNAITELPAGDYTSDIYVRYTYNRNNGILDIENGKEYNLIINSNKQIWMTYEKGYGSNNDIGIGSAENYENSNHLWKFEGGDPYGIYISNKASSNHVTGNRNSFGVNENTAALGYTAALHLSYSDQYYPHRFFLVKSPLWTAENPLYLMRVSMYDANAYDKIYTWGWEQTEGNVWDKSYCRMWRIKDDTDPALQLQIRPHVMDPITYHVIDKQNKEVVSATIESKDLELPSDISSPLVSEYHYYTLDQFTTTTRNDSTIYTLNSGATALTKLGSNTEIYVTYDVDPDNNILTVIDPQDEAASRKATLDKRDKDKFLTAGGGIMRVFNMKFLNGNSFRQENGKDGFEDDATQAIYPYTNGDGNMYIYGAKDWTEQLSQGASTRTRWPWFITSKNNDPYHVVITSYKETHNEKQDPIKDDEGENIKGQKNYYSYFRTYYEPNYYGDGKGRIITANVTDDPRVWNTERNVNTDTLVWKDANNEAHSSANAVPTEYMLLGKTGHYKLLTVSPVDDGDDSTTDERQYVHSFEQYWKTWDTVRRWNDETKDFDNYEAGRVTTALSSYHAYKTWANALPDVPAKGSKRYAYETHYFQTIEMGEEFDLEEVSFNPVMVLVDNHGWEVMRRTIVPKGDKDRTNMELYLNSYNSPAVEKYLWYTTGKKADGYQKYSLADPGFTIYKKDEKGKWVEDTSKEKYVHTSTTLSDIPYDYLTTEQGYGTDMTQMKDLYVTYIVKDEYKNAYNSEDNTSAPFLFKQGSNYASTDSTGISPVAASDVTSSTDGKYLGLTGSGISDNLLWYLKRNVDIDHEMGYLYEGEANAEPAAKSKEETEDDYNNLTDSLQHNGFDPYNVQVQAVTGSKYLTTTATDAVLYYDGTVRADKEYTTVGLNDHVEDDAHQAFTFINHGNKLAHVTNQTYMLIKDVSGNNRLFPRFDHLRAVEDFTKMGQWNSENAGKVTEFIPVGHYTIIVCDYNEDRNNNTPTPIVQREVWAKAGMPIGESPTDSIPLPNDLVRAGLYYEGAFTTYDSETVVFSDKTMVYPIASNLAAEGGTPIYIPYRADGTGGSIWFASSEEDAKTNQKWNFLMMGTDSRACLYGTDPVNSGGKNVNSYDYVSPADSTMVRYYLTGDYGIGGFNFIVRSNDITYSNYGTELKYDSGVSVDPQTGNQSVTTGDDRVGIFKAEHYMQSNDERLMVHLTSPLNDFARIAETYRDDAETQFREGRWLWGFIGNPYTGFYIINKEVADANISKRLAVIKATQNGTRRYVKLLNSEDYNFDAKTGDEYNYPSLWQTTMLDTSGDAESAGTFGIVKLGSDSIVSRYNIDDMCLDLEATPTASNTYGRKRSSFRCYPWQGTDGKYKTVTVNIYQDAVSGEPVMSRTFNANERVFIAGDVIDGTDGHFYLPIEGQADGSWKPAGVTRRMPYDNHLINIPFELRRQFCKYKVVGGNHTINSEGDAYCITDASEQTINIVYTIDTENAPLFVSEEELSTFRSLADNATFKGAKKKDYYYFMDSRWQMNAKMRVSSDGHYPFSSLGNRFSAPTPRQLMYYFVGNPYKMRVFNVFTDDKNAGKNFNLVRNKYPDNKYGAYGEDASNYNKAYMEDEDHSNGKFYWEMVGVSDYGSFLSQSNTNVYYRKDKIKDKFFALRMADISDASKATYYYMRYTGQTAGSEIYSENGQSSTPRGNKLNAFAYYPDSRHQSNTFECMMVPLKPAKVHLTVYDPDEPSRKVTQDEVSEYYAVTDRFTGVPDNLKRNYCDYYWASTNSDIRTANMLEGGYFEIEDKELSLYARYRETDDSPFSKLVNGVPTLKQTGTWDTPWFNMKVNNYWAYFNSGLTGLTSPVYNYNNSTKKYDQLIEGSANQLNNSLLSFPYDNTKEPIENANWKFQKGMQWALIGDPYNFYLQNRRDVITLGNDGPAVVGGEYEYNTAYLLDTNIGTTPTTWTWLRNATTNNNYFLSESNTRRTELAEASSGAKPTAAPRRILPSDYTISAATATHNFTVTNWGSQMYTGNPGDNYALGSTMELLSVNDAQANNEAFDAVVIVYNKMNEPVATTGWTELSRNDSEKSVEIPSDVRRWGCEYTYWADSTMTTTQVSSFNQTTDGEAKSESNEYLIGDKSIVYVKYNYDESLYSSENEYRWMNLFFNWDDNYKQWTLDDVPNKYKYTAEYWEYVAASGETEAHFDKTHQYRVNQNVKEWTGHDLYTNTSTGWIESPKVDHDNLSVSKAYAYWSEGQYTQSTDSMKNQKWALIGDPYRFILYNYNRKQNADANNAYYLYNDETDNNNPVIINKNFTGDDALTTETKPKKQGIYWTWKVDGTKYSFKKRNGEANSSVEYALNGLPQSFYTNYSGNDYTLETGYLAVCDMEKNSYYDVENLLGSVKGYATFNNEHLTETQTDETETYNKGSKEKYKVYTDDPGVDTDKDRDYTTFGDITDTDQRTAALSLWKSTYKTVGNSTDTDGDGIYDNGDYQGCYVGPNPEKEEVANTTREYIQTMSSVADIDQYLSVTGGASQGTALVTGTAQRFLVMPMQAHAASVTFHLDPTIYTDGTDISSMRDFATDPVYDYTSETFGVNNTIALPWMMRRQFCDYTFYQIEVGDNAPANKTGYVDALTYTENTSSTNHKIETRSIDYKSFWHDGNKNDKKLNNTLNVSADAIEIEVPDEWQNKHVYLRVTYQPRAEFYNSTSNDGSVGNGKTVRWVNIVNQQKGNMMQYTRTNKVTGVNTDSINDVTNDYLWAIEGDPYGFKLHNRYADHGFNGTSNQYWSSKLLGTRYVNSTLNYNVNTPDNYFTFGTAATATAPGEMSAASHSVYEAMTGNYDGAMMIHPVDAGINVKNQNGYKYSGAFMFNGISLPVQLNYMEEWDAMRNVYCNWRIQRPTKEQLLPYYNRAGYVGGLKADVATNTELSYDGGTVDVPALFGKLAAGTATSAEFNTAWALVHNPDNLVQFESGAYYRVKPYSNNSTVGGEYVSGYLHKLEKDANAPLHLFEKAGTATTLDKLENYDGNAWAEGIESKIEVMNPEYDPSTIFRFTRDGDGYIKMETQGLVVSDNGMTEGAAAPEEGDEATAEYEAQFFQMQDVGLASFQMRTKANTSGEAAETSYLSYNPNTMKYGLNASANELNISEGVSSGTTVKTHDTMWMLEPVGTTETALKVKMIDMGYNDFYASVCFPFDVKLPKGAYAFGFQMNENSWRDKQEDNTFKLNVAQIAGNDDSSPNDGSGNLNMVIPAGVPALIYVYNKEAYLEDLKDNFAETKEVPVTIAGANDCKLTEGQLTFLRRSDNAMKYQYLTQELSDVPEGKTVFVFGQSHGKVGFMRNSNKDYTDVVNNHFVVHNKIYYIGDYNGDSGNGAKVIGLNFVSLQDLMDDSETTGVTEVETDDSRKGNYGDGTIYDLQGRKVEHINRTGIYIVNGRKVLIKK